jgi:succinoglycan biosynthesis transport protein ExoP
LDASDIASPSPSDPPPPLPVPARSGGLLTLLREEGDGSVAPGEFFSVLRRQRRIIFACIAIITAISAAVVLQLTPRYTAQSSILLDTRKTQVIDLQSVISGLPPDNAVVRSEIEVLRSPALAMAVAQKLDLVALPEFNPRLRPPSLGATLRQSADAMIENLKPLLGIAPEKPAVETDPDPAKSALLTAALILRGEMDATNDGRSYVINIKVTSQDPKLAAALADAYADTYFQAQLDAKFEAVRRANDWLNDHLTRLRQDVEAADRAVQTFRAEHNLAEAKGETVTTQQLAEVNSQLILAAADRAQKEASVRQLRDQLRAGNVEAAIQVLNSPLILELRKQESELLQKQAQLATRYKPAHPAMINIKAQIQDLDQKIHLEIDKIVHALEGEAAAARARESSLRDSLTQVEKSTNAQSEVEVRLHELQRQADSSRLLYENFLNRFKQTSTQEDIQQPDARLIAAAIVPGAPSYPRTRLLVGVAFVASVLIGILAAFGMERLDNCFRTPDQVEKLAKVPALGLVPTLKTRGPPHEVIVASPMVPYSEAIRTIRTALRYSDIDHPPKVVLVTSALPSEGKSMTSLSLARSVARSGGRSLLIDCDLRRPSVARAMKLDDKLGLLSLFDDAGMDFRAALQVDQPSGMHVLTAASGTANPQDLLGSNRMRELIAALRPHYDFIVLDTPPILGASDALILSHIADTTLFLVRWGQTPRPVVLGALTSFRANGGTLAGVVLTRVDLRKHATYGYGDFGYFYGHYHSYYGRYGGRYGGER